MMSERVIYMEIAVRTGHNGVQQSFKVDTHVVFPAWLNMAPYLSAGQELAGEDQNM